MPTNPILRQLRKLARSDEHVARALARVGPPPPRSRPPGFPALFRTIVGQQVSAKAAMAMWRRIEEAVVPLAPERVATMSAAELRALGLSRQKVRYALGLADDLVSGRIDLARVHQLPDDEAVDELVKIKGIGRWSAEVYLLFALGRPDVFPSGDLALQTAFQRLKGLRRRPEPHRLLKLVEPWRPYRGAGAHFLWHFYAAPPMD
ncbi:MAG TPA: DNA-3-methyladenine glycosylase 2 family protein [Alphaproteobacteria bacterium]|nr:DNA-3-methyladenine glycosylase 2 family protein [Alphaproteobacteria bacterium]